MKLIHTTLIICLFVLQVKSSALSSEIQSSSMTSLSKTSAYLIVDKISQSINWDELKSKNISLTNSLQKTFDKMKNVDLLVTLGSIEQGSAFQSKERQTDFYGFNRNFGSLNPEWFVGGDGRFGTDREARDSFVDRARIAILVHIMLGASGQHDEYYHKTLAISLIANCFSNSDINSLCENENEKNTFVRMILPYFEESTHVADGGGSTGAIGGGDLLSLILKIELTTNLLVHINFDSNCSDKEYGLSAICEKWPDKFSYIDSILKFEIESKQNITEVVSELVTGGNIRITVPKIVITKTVPGDLKNQKLLLEKINKLQTGILVQLINAKGEK